MNARELEEAQEPYGVSWTPPVDIGETAAEYVITAELPGMTEEDLSVRVEGDLLKLTGSRRPSVEIRGAQFRHVERGYGRFLRVFRLPSKVCAQPATRFADGLLVITLSKQTETPPGDGAVEVAYDESRNDLTAAEAAVLASAGFDLERRALGSRDPLARTAAAYAELVASALTTGQAAERLGVNASRIRQRLAEGNLYGVRHGSRWLLPAFQFTDEGELPGLAKVLPELHPGLHPLAVERWFLLPNPDLSDPESEEPLSPRDWLRTGRPPEATVQAAVGV